MSRRGTRTLARQMLVWQLVVVTLLVVGAVALAWVDARGDSRETARTSALDVSRSVASSQTVVDALGRPDPSATLQPFAERVRRGTGVDFVVIMNPDGIRYSHPDARNIGRTFLGHISAAQRGRSLTEDYTGTLGPSVRAVVPVMQDGRVEGLVSVGIRTATVDREVVAALPRIFGAALVVGLLGALGAWLTSRRLRRQTHGLGEREITRMYEYYDAVLRAVREGLLLIDRTGRLTMMNDEARRLLALGDDVVEGRSVDQLGLEPGLAHQLVSGGRLRDAVHVVGDRVLVVNHTPATWDGRDVGSVVTLRDRTELQTVTAELDTVQGLADALRAQTHESSNRLHTMVSLIEIGRADKAVDFATRELDIAREMADRLVESINEPILAALLLGKSAQAAERGVTLTIDTDSTVTGLLLTSHEVVTVVGNVLDNAIDAAQSSADRQVSVNLASSDDVFHLEVGDSGPGVAPGDRDSVFARGWSTKPDESGAGRGIGLALVGQVIRRHGGTAVVGTSPLGGASLDIRISHGTAGSSA